MKTGSVALQTLLAKSDSIPLTQQLTAEWNYNRFATVTSIDNNPPLPQPATTWDTLFPIADIVQPDRPSSGIVKGFTDEALITTTDTNATAGFRSYPCDIKDPYKYWISPVASGTVKDSTGGYPFSTTCIPTVIYSAQLQTNKIVVGIENSLVSPWDWTIEVSTDGVAWTSIAYNPSIGSDGRVTLYLQANGTWGTTVSYGNGYYALKGLRVKVNSINAAGKWAQIIEMSPRREDDITTYMSDWSVTYEQSNRSFLSPLGQISSNVGSISLFNEGNIFDNENAASPYFGMIDKNVKFILQSGIDTTSFGGAGVEWVREFTMRSIDWAGSKTAKVTVNIADSSEKMKTMYPPETMFQGLTAGEIIWRLMDIMGWSNWNYINTSNDSSTVIPYYWTSGDTTQNAIAVRKNRLRYLPTKNTFWDELNKISEGTQLAIYFDPYDVLQIKTRESEFDVTKPISWTLRGEPAGTGELADIVDWSHTGTYESNHIDVQYTPTDVSKFNNGFPVMETVWTPTADTTLRSTPLARPINTKNNGEKIAISPAEAAYWPYTGMVNIDGEYISYNGKEYVYYNTSGGKTTEVLYTIDRKNVIDQTLSNVNMAWANAFNGNLVGTTRAQYSSDAALHTSTSIHPYSTPYFHNRTAGVYGNSNPGCLHYNGDSTLTVTTNKTFYDWKNKQLVYPTDAAMAYGTSSRYGTRLRIKSGVTPSNVGEGGLFFATNSTNASGYFVSVVPTDVVEGQARKSGNEVYIWRRDSSGNTVPLSLGNAFPVTRDNWYDLEVSLTYTGVNHLITVYINGANVAQALVTPGANMVTGGNTFGVFVGSQVAVDFEYLYAVGKDVPEDQENTNYMDKITGDFTSNYVHNLVFPKPAYPRNNSKTSLYKWKWYSAPFYDDFGSHVHEVRDFSIDFDKNPSIHSKLWISNDSQIDCIDYNADPFGADFTLVNTSRNNAVLTGSDTLMYGINDPVQQQCFVYGRLVTPSTTPVIITSMDLDSIRRRSTINTTFNSMWIQTKDQAQALADWIVGHWSKGQQEVDVKMFGGRLLEVGDLITVDWPSKGYTAGTNKWYVVKVNSQSNQGIDDTITIRRSTI